MSLEKPNKYRRGRGEVKLKPHRNIYTASEPKIRIRMSSFLIRAMKWIFVQSGCRQTIKEVCFSLNINSKIPQKQTNIRCGK